MQPTQLGSHQVPGLFRYMVPEDVFYFRIDSEVKSTCFQCPQVAQAGFHPDIRCCTFIPRIPNFLLGMALQDPLTRPKVKAYIEGGFATPEGTHLSPQQLRDSLNHVAKVHEQSEPLACPFLDKQKRACGIYSYRCSSCSFFFCINDRGENGRVFWDDMQAFVSQIETALAQWTMNEMGYDLKQYFQTFDELGADVKRCEDPSSKAWSPYALEKLFGPWYGREVEYFEACANRVLEQKEQLYTLAQSQPLHQSPGFDEAQRQALSPVYPEELIQEALPKGRPESLASLWYSLQRSHRRLWETPSASPNDQDA